MATAIHILNFIIKVLLFIVFLPVCLLWLFIKHRIYKAALIRSLRLSGMPKAAAKDLAGETGPRNLFRLQ